MDLEEWANFDGEVGHLIPKREASKTPKKGKKLVGMYTLWIIPPFNYFGLVIS